MWRNLFRGDNFEDSEEGTSIYERRRTSAYKNMKSDPRYAKNKHILKWWSKKHDKLISETIKAYHWLWFWHIVDVIVNKTPFKTIEAWKAEDPVCAKYDWHNVLMYFSLSRAQELNLTRAIRKPKWKRCPLCGHKFVEDSVPGPFVMRLGFKHIDFCAPCLSSCIDQSRGNVSMSRNEIVAYLQDLTAVIQIVPTQNFADGIQVLAELSPKERLALLKVLRRRPTTKRVKELFGSWLGALIEAGVLEDGTRKTRRGIQCLALDGHLCLSLAEKTIDDYFFKSGISHEKEVRYPEGGYRADFAVGSIFIEYFGLTGDAEYDKKTKAKQALCKKHGIKLISLYPQDLTSSRKFELKLAALKQQN